MFGGSAAAHPRAAVPSKGDDLRYDLTLTFEEAVFGKAVEIQVPKLEACDALQRQRRRAGQRFDHLSGLPRPRRADLFPGISFRAPHLFQLRRRRPDRQAGLPRLPRRRLPADQQAHPRHRARRHRRRQSSARARRRTARRQRRSARRSLYLLLRQRTPDLRAARKRSALHHSHQRRAGRAGRRDRGADARRSARTLRFPRARRAAPSFASRAKAFPKCRAAAAAIWSCISTSRSPPS